MNIAVGGTWGGAQGIDEAAFLGSGQIMEVDWIRVFNMMAEFIQASSNKRDAK